MSHLIIRVAFQNHIGIKKCWVFTRKENTVATTGRVKRSEEPTNSIHKFLSTNGYQAKGYLELNSLSLHLLDEFSQMAEREL